MLILLLMEKVSLCFFLRYFPFLVLLQQHFWAFSHGVESYKVHFSTNSISQYSKLNNKIRTFSLHLPPNKSLKLSFPTPGKNAVEICKINWKLLSFLFRWLLKINDFVFSWIPRDDFSYSVEFIIVLRATRNFCSVLLFKQTNNKAISHRKLWIYKKKKEVEQENNLN